MPNLSQGPDLDAPTMAPTLLLPELELPLVLLKRNHLR